jgi:hypothetical protein
LLFDFFDSTASEETWQKFSKKSVPMHIYNIKAVA